MWVGDGFVWFEVVYYRQCGGCVGLREKVEVTRRYLRFVFPVCRNDFVMF